ncbi:MAG: hypothetical protein KGL39_60695 [Patescibacteria group bacterium]|nr:hypothetical protein [Patescibacteria group bacterium]
MIANEKLKSDNAYKSGCWLYAEYGFSLVVGQVVARVKNGYLMRFRWGNPYRTTQFVHDCAIFGKAKDPRWLSRFTKLFKSSKHPNPSSATADAKRPD